MRGERIAKSLVLVLALCASHARAGDGTSVEKALETATEFEFVETPVEDAVKFLSDLHNIRIVVDEAAFKKAGKKPDEPVNLILSGISLRSALNLTMRKARCEYRIESDRIVILPETQKKAGAPGAKGKAPPEPKAHALIRKKLKDETEFRFLETPLKDALQFLADVHDVQIVVDERGFEGKKFDSSVPINIFSRPKMTLQEGLKGMLEPLALEARVENEVLFVSSAKSPAVKPPVKPPE